MQRYSAGSYEIVEDDDGEYYLADEVDTDMQAKDAEIAELLKDVTFLQSGKDVIRDELRAEVDRRSEMHECAMAERDDCILDWSDTKAERDRLAAEVERLTDAIAREEKAHDITISQRDRAEVMADKLARAIGGDEVGEHSSADCPWSNALDMASTLTADLATSRAETAAVRERLLKWCDERQFDVVNCMELRANEEANAVIWLNNFRAAISTLAEATAALSARDKATRERALRDAASLADISMNNGGMAKSMAMFVRVSDWDADKDTLLSYRDAILSLIK